MEILQATMNRAEPGLIRSNRAEPRLFHLPASDSTGGGCCVAAHSASCWRCWGMTKVEGSAAVCDTAAGPDWLRLRGDVTRETLAARGAVPHIPQDGASAGAARSRDRRRQGKAAQEVHSVVQFEHVTQIQMWVCV